MKQELQTPAYQNLYTAYDSFIKVRSLKGRMYQRNVNVFLIWLERYGITDIKQVTTKIMLVYYQHLIERPNLTRGGTLADNTIKGHLLSIAMFVENLLTTGIMVKAFDIPRHGNQDQKPRDYLTIEEIKLVYQHTENPLEKAILSVGYGCGLRRSEMENLNVSDVQLSSGILIVRSGKGDKRRQVPMSDTVLADVKHYVTEYRYQRLADRQHQKAFFINKKGNRMSGETVGKELKKILIRTNSPTILDKEITLHSLRHSIANHLMENSAGIDFIKDFLGHSFINTSYIYAIKNKKRFKPI
ncbi:tyrosine-type recombinase/integrase [Flavobacterium zepuense]|uniref:Tyrosine-type recombinase/integrase n=1 Tax=Flavobacterium zepuense TaxID=2593302 RepID=A0A552UTA2_9FLAO|nr:tyrosine-type recombinase/integrase [Flavobacterium zepuense]TRW21462.1 tyrosine-type recombinase/integrase [Flavobacterium zepuense]